MRLQKRFTAVLLIAIIVIAYNLAAKTKREQTGTFITSPVSVRLNRIPDQSEIIFHVDGYIYAMDRGGSDVTQITFERPRQFEHVAVSCDRRFIVANEQLPNPTNQPGGNSVIWLYDLERGTEAQLVPEFKTAGNGGVDWDANGFIYFAAQDKDVVPNPQTPDDHIKNAVANDVYKIRHDGTGLLRLAQTTDGAEADVGVSLDGSLVSYIREVINFPGENHTEVWVINPDGSKPRMIYKGGLVKQASVHDPEISADNKQVAFSKVNPEFKNFPDNPLANTAHDLYVINFDGTGLRRVTRPGPISILPNWKDNLILYSEINEAAQYAGISIVSDQGTDQLPERIRSGPFAPNWIPQACSIQILRKGNAVDHLVAGVKARKYQISLNGSGFTSESKVLIDGAEAETSLASGTVLTVKLPFKRVPDVEALTVEVRDAGGQVSNSLTIEVRRE